MCVNDMLCRAFFGLAHTPKVVPLIGVTSDSHWQGSVGDRLVKPQRKGLDHVTER